MTASAPPVACVVVPAHREADRIAACVRALGAQRGIVAAWEVILVLDGCDDATGAIAARTAREHGVRLDVRTTGSTGPVGAGRARRRGMALAARRLAPDGLLASTDADTCVAPDWLAAQLALVRGGARAIGGLVELDRVEAAALPRAALLDRELRAVDRLAAVRAVDPAAEHHHFAGASLAVTAATWTAVGGMDDVAVLEDEALARSLERHGVPIVRTTAVRVRTSARRDGRAAAGLAVDLARAPQR